MFYKIVMLVLTPLFMSGLQAQQSAPPQAGTDSIRNFLRVNDQFCTGGQPRIEVLATLKAEGVKSIINLRVPTEHRASDEEAEAKRLGLKYFNIPVVYAEPKNEQVDEFLRITDDPQNRPAFIHCTAAIRVGAFWMIRRVVRDGWPIEKARDDLADGQRHHFLGGG